MCIILCKCMSTNVCKCIYKCICIHMYSIGRDNHTKHMPKTHVYTHTHTHTHTHHVQHTRYSCSPFYVGEGVSSYSIRLLPFTSRPLTKLIRLAPNRNCVREVKVGKRTLQATRAGDGQYSLSFLWVGRETSDREWTH